MKKLFIFMLIIFCFCNCNSINKESQDKKVFDSFIGVSKEEIITTFGGHYRFSYEHIYDNGGSVIKSIYFYKYCRRDLVVDYDKYNKPIYISTSTRSFYIFNFFTEVTFIIKDNYCTDYSAY
jgi:hypothetical protein